MKTASISHAVPVALLAVVLLGLAGCSNTGSNESNPTGPGPTPGNTNPTVNLNIDRVHLSYGELAQLSVTASDPDGDQVTFTWSATLGSVSASGPTATMASFVAGSQWGQASVTVTASDGRGGTAQATALTYIRNPDPPAFVLGAAGSSTCGTGTQNPFGFILTITPPEPVTIRRIRVEPRSCTGQCRQEYTYSPALTWSAGSTYQFSQAVSGSPRCLTPDCCQSQSCGNCRFWTITITGERPEPDGGTFFYECGSWADPGDSCN